MPHQLSLRRLPLNEANRYAPLWQQHGCLNIQPIPQLYQPIPRLYHRKHKHQLRACRSPSNSVWVDERLAYEASLRGGMKKRLLLFRRVRGNQSRSLLLPTGEHRLRVRVQSAGIGYDQEASILGTFGREVERTLQVKCNNKKLELKLASAAVAQ